MKQKRPRVSEEITEGNLFADSVMDDLSFPTSASDTPKTGKHRGRPRSTETEDRPPLTFEKMREILEGIHEIETPTGIRYVQLRLTKRMVIGVRESSGKEFTINLDELYKAYQECRRFSSPEVKRIIFMGHSPAVILLKLLKKAATSLPSVDQ